ncbi:hypothetical protein, partial [Acetobacter tropicalis]|uniref:hypothetical protein n=1 Tax=Acetobacter tropicalis TaxID=104102 RepID=UPI000587D161
KKSLTYLDIEKELVCSDTLELFYLQKKLPITCAAPCSHTTRYEKLIPEEDTYFVIREKYEPMFHFSYPSKTFEFMGMSEKHLICDYSRKNSTFSLRSHGVCILMYDESGFILECDEQIDHIIPDYIQDITEEEIFYLKLQEII